jgi:hypothetical protein
MRLPVVLGAILPRVEQGLRPCMNARVWIGFSHCGTYHQLEKYLSG